MLAICALLGFGARPWVLEFDAFLCPELSAECESEKPRNSKLADKVEAGYFSGANLLLINKVDDQGQRIARAFGANTSIDKLLMYVCTYVCD